MTAASTRIDASAISSCFRGKKYLPGFLASVAQQTTGSRAEVILVHNEPSSNELELVRRFQADHPGLVRHVVVEHVEPLAVSMNRAIDLARGRYVAIWNVDDIRTDDSLAREIAVLDSDPDLVATYGDYRVVTELGSTYGKNIVLPPFDPEQFTRGMYMGCFPMWRASACDRAGVFDEQLLQGADFDLMVRLAFNGRMRKTDGMLGYYLNERAGLSTRPDSLQPIERTVIERRYGIYERIEYLHFRRASDYHIDMIRSHGRWRPVADVVPNYRGVIRSRRRRIWLGLLRFVLATPYRAIGAARLRGAIVHRLEARRFERG